METLANLYEKPSTLNKAFLMKHLFNMKIVKDDFFVDNLNDFNMFTSQLSSINVNFDEEIRALLIMWSLLES